jgi:branched-chain amino acid transport system permease protein
MRGRHLWAHLVVLALLILFPLGSDRIYNPFYISLLNRVLIYGIMVLGYDLLGGYAGMISYGHAMFFGTGGYVAAMLLIHLTPWFWLPFIAAVLGCGLLAYIVGYLSIRTRHIYFVFLTFAFAQFFFVGANTWDFIGGETGLAGVPKPILLPHITLSGKFMFYYFTLFLLVIGYILARRIVHSPFGRVLVGTRDNEERTRFLGYDTNSAIRRVFIISGMYGGAAGVMIAVHNSFCSPMLYHPSVSGEVIIMSLLGGLGTLIGPLIGALFMILLADTISSWFANAWMGIMGALFAICVLFTPEGLVGAVRKWRSSRMKRAA